MKRFVLSQLFFFLIWRITNAQCFLDGDQLILNNTYFLKTNI